MIQALLIGSVGVLILLVVVEVLVRTRNEWVGNTSFPENVEVAERSLRRLGFSCLTEPERVVLLIGAMQRELDSNGLLLFFMRPTGEYAVETLSALNRIGALESESILEQAIELVFRDELPAADQRERLEQIERPSSEQQEALFEDLRNLDRELAFLADQIPPLVDAWLDTQAPVR